MPSPGGPTRRTWSSASPRAFAAVERDRELLLDPLLADELVEPARAEALLELVLLVVRRQNGAVVDGTAWLALMPAFFNASRTRSSGGRSGSTSASARSASSSE